MNLQKLIQNPVLHSFPKKDLDNPLISILGAVNDELVAGHTKKYNVLVPADYEGLALDLRAEEIAAMALVLENPTYIILLDNGLAHRTEFGERRSYSRHPRLLQLDEAHRGIMVSSCGV